ncbi:MAG TPA: hypothetical protein VKV28_10875 [Candidatus Binataceae bacterium]|nr:hypothetical protein [Candidatus Binataceae bacterium]
MPGLYDRAIEDLGNIVGLEHVNTTIPDQQLATLFYIAGLGLTRDPFIMVSTNNIWANVGRSQFHLPTNKPQVLRGHVGLVLPEREPLLRRLEAVRKPLAGTLFDFQDHEEFVEAVSPWGNRFRCYEPHERFGRITLGMPYVEFQVPIGTAEGIARFYRQVMNAPATVSLEDGRHARVAVGIDQDLIFRESAEPQPPYDGHHVQIYVANFSGPYRRLLEMGLITEESDQHQYRFKDLVDPEGGKSLYTLEHEVRSMRHPLFGRPLINRNPAQSNVHYAPGYDAWNWHMERAD